MPAPIALFVYNRPIHARRTIEALAANPEAHQSDLYVFSDGPKNDQSVQQVDEVRRLMETVTGFRRVEIVRRPRNLGLSASIVGGVGALCNEFGRAIVVEDDLLVSPTFLAFMNDALARYADSLDVMQVSGYMFPVAASRSDEAVFLPLISCWGWATWKRAWDLYDPDMRAFADLEQDRALRRRFDLDGAYGYFDMLRRQRAGAIDSWGVRWLLSVFMRDGLVLYPPRTMVDNIGFDGSGTHGKALIPTVASEREVRPPAPALPDRIEVDQSTLEAVKQHLRRSRQRIRPWLARHLGL
jgi:hypothetical protein